jgi:hypothetical protein
MAARFVLSRFWLSGVAPRLPLQSGLLRLDALVGDPALVQRQQAGAAAVDHPLPAQGREGQRVAVVAAARPGGENSAVGIGGGRRGGGQARGITLQQL